MIRLLNFAGTLLLLVLFGTSCGSGPKVIEPASSNSSTSETGVFSETSNAGTQQVSGAGSSDQDIHTVKVIEAIPTQKYSYLKVQENGKEFWVATIKGNFEVGSTYHYKGGLLKRNFKSVEHNRVFEELYLISNIVPLDHGSDSHSVPEATSTAETSSDIGSIEVEGSTKIADIVANAAELNGQTIQVSGKVVKVNPNIMSRNWIHLKDGSKDDYDLVLTTDEAAPVGHVVTYKAVVTTNKDFGAGYAYELILEEGELIK